MINQSITNSKEKLAPCQPEKERTGTG